MNNNQDEDIESLYDDEPEELDETPETPEEGMEDAGGVSEPSQSFNPQNNFRRNQEYHNRNYYKDRVNETQDKRDDAQQRRNETKQQRQQAKDSYKDAKKGNKSDEGYKDNKKAAKNEYKNAKKEDKAARQDYRDAKRANRQAKFDKFANDANTMMHPGEALKNKAKDKLDQINPVNMAKKKAEQIKDKAKDKVKDGAKKAGKAAKDGAKKAGKAVGKAAKEGGKKVAQGVAKLLAKIPPQVWAVIGGILLAVILIAVIATIISAVISNDNNKGGDYSYEVNGVEIGNVNVQIMDSAGNVVSTMDMEEYAKGLALGSMKFDQIATHPNSFKTAVVIARSSILLNADASSGVIKVNNTVPYWDYKQDFYKVVDENGVTTYVSSDTNPGAGAELIHKKLTEEEIKQIDELIKSIGGLYITGDSLSGLELDESTINSLISKEESGEISDYNDIIASQYPDATINTGNYVTHTFSGEAGEYANWKQGDAKWGDIWLGNNSGTTMRAIGCYVTSYAIAIAYLDAPTTLTDFNPGTFATELKKNGAFGSGGGFNNFNAAVKIVPGLKKERIFTSGLTKAEKISKVRAEVEKGYAVIMQVKCANYYTNGGNCSGSTHFVVVDPMGSSASGWSTLAIWNPSGQKTWDQYNNVMPYYDRVWVAK